MASSRIEMAVDDLDLTVKYIRTAIFGLEGSRVAPAGARRQVLDVVEDATASLGFEPRVMIDGPLDTALDDGLIKDLLAVLREALSNVARHAQASRATVDVVVTDDKVVLKVTDNGVGPPSDEPTESGGGLGLGNMATRAGRYDGTFELKAAKNGGAILEWCARRTP